MDKMNIITQTNFLGWFIAACVVGYLLGSLPFGLILTKLAGLGDIRKIGSGNIGTTNVLRTGNRKIAAATLIADMLKGTIAVVIFLFLLPGDEGEILGLVAALCAFLGHLFPLWLHFKGGKGVATYLGILLALAPWSALAFVTVWLAIAVISRYSSLSALIGVVVVAFSALLMMDGIVAMTLAFMSLIIIIKHHANIKRLLTGTESKITLSRGSGKEF